MKQPTETPDSLAGQSLGAATLLDGKTIEQWKYAAELCAAGRFHEWEQHCALTARIQRVSEYLKWQSAHGNNKCRKALLMLDGITMELYGVHADKCAARMPSNDGTQN